MKAFKEIAGSEASNLNNVKIFKQKAIKRDARHV